MPDEEVPMSSIADALKRAQQERDRLKASPAAAEKRPEPPRNEPSLASVVLRKNAAPTAAPAASTNEDEPVLAAAVASRESITAPLPVTPVTPLTTALRQAPIEVPPVVKTEQRAAETIVEDYASKRDLNLPSAVVVYHERSGPIAEQYRKIRDGLMATHFRGAGASARRSSQTFVITSARPGEGKTTTVLNLGLSLVEVRSTRVLLIDGCLHPSGRTSLTGLLHLEREKGLAELLAAPATENIESYLKATPWHNLFILPTGARTTPGAAAGLLQSSMLRSVLRHASNHFDWVLIDAPAASRFPDAGLLGAPSDGILMTIALHRTPHTEVQTTMRRLKSMNLPLKSCILTRA